jgi:hypothetical protein
VAATQPTGGGRRSGRATADHQHVGFGENWNFTRGLEKRFAGADVPHPLTAAKQLKTLNGADAAAVITAAWGIAENLAFPRRSHTGFGFFAGRHFATSTACPVGSATIVINDSHCSTPCAYIANQRSIADEPAQSAPLKAPSQGRSARPVHTSNGN